MIQTMKGYVCPTCGLIIMGGEHHTCYGFENTPYISNINPCDTCKLWNKCKKYRPCFEAKEDLGDCPVRNLERMIVESKELPSATKDKYLRKLVIADMWDDFKYHSTTIEAMARELSEYTDYRDYKIEAEKTIKALENAITIIKLSIGGI